VVRQTLPWDSFPLARDSGHDLPSCLPAAHGEMIRAALGRPLMLLLSGSIAGLVLGILASRLLAQIVYEATPHDPLVLAGTIVTMALLGLLATWIPARRSMSIDPARLLRED